ncbi:serine/threonine-protein kinase [Actinomadura sp. NEAU-AAG7]|uniref:serine/threonine-protein kinase n=1 Tax=Actinomadura sp. NEAU-AAG7 TaxID=2839640 RepID=UPI001BE3DA73|nr:serine/threonine-protein kinase [Actinomadura sp. NEAU-AAG7]MBT2208597.1 serine/threonine protein kinase [Actinomadura sp. NEAU-AAG7]
MPRSWSVPGFVELGELGAGAQGEVVLARHQSGGLPVAIKYLAPGLLTDAAARATFRGEAELLKRVVDPHVARLLHYQESPWGAAIVLEAVRGRSLRRVLDTRAEPLTPEAALTTLKGSLLGLAAAHAAGVVHRDYKPANVLVQDDGLSKLIDFGVAVLAGQGGVGGTPTYMAPEQWAGAAASPATDLYAATCVFVECVSGARPFEAPTLEGLRAAHSGAPIPLERVPEPLRPLVRRGMAKNPADRFWNAHAFLGELETAAIGAYGPDWERRGALALAALAAAVATAAPLAMLGGALVGPGSAVTDLAAKAGGSVGKGVLGKLGGTKGVTAASIGGVGAAVVVGWLLWPTGPQVGGQSQGEIHASFTRPGVLLRQPNMPASETPSMDLKLSVAPARVKPGTDVRLVIEFRARTLGSVEYGPGGRRRCLGEEGPRTGPSRSYSFGLGADARDLGIKDEGILAFYPTPPAASRELPNGRKAVMLPATSTTTGVTEPWIQAECAYRSRWTETRTLVLPGAELLEPGKYLVSPSVPPRFWRTTRNGVEFPPEEAGAVARGALPVIEVLRG